VFTGYMWIASLKCFHGTYDTELFQQKYVRTISLNVQYIVLFKNLHNNSQFAYLAMQDRDIVTMEDK